jgi:hypothetical protein
VAVVFVTVEPPPHEAATTVAASPRKVNAPLPRHELREVIALLR